MSKAQLRPRLDGPNGKQRRSKRIADKVEAAKCKAGAEKAVDQKPKSSCQVRKKKAPAGRPKAKPKRPAAQSKLAAIRPQTRACTPEAASSPLLLPVLLEASRTAVDERPDESSCMEAAESVRGHDIPEQRPSFMTLPPEIRTMVYGLVVVSDEPLFLRLDDDDDTYTGPPPAQNQAASASEPGSGSSIAERHHPSMLSLLLVNRQIYTEASPIAYRDNRFEFTDRYDLSEWLHVIGQNHKFVKNIALISR